VGADYSAQARPDDLRECSVSAREPSAASMQELSASADAAERELLVACNALYIATDAAVADDVKRKARAVIETHTAFNHALAARVKP
jgi:hypothetical protein